MATGRQFTCTIWDRPVVVAADGHFPYSPSYRCQRYCCMTRIALRRQAAVLQLMTKKLAMAIVVAAKLEAASDSYRKRSMDFVRLLGPFQQITPTFWLDFILLLFSVFTLLFKSGFKFRSRSLLRLNFAELSRKFETVRWFFCFRYNSFDITQKLLSATRFIPIGVLFVDATLVLFLFFPISFVRYFYLSKLGLSIIPLELAQIDNFVFLFFLFLNCVNETKLQSIRALVSFFTTWCDVFIYFNFGFVFGTLMICEYFKMRWRMIFC